MRIIRILPGSKTPGLTREHKKDLDPAEPVRPEADSTTASTESTTSTIGKERDTLELYDEKGRIIKKKI